jgi:hypothetical protein
MKTGRLPVVLIAFAVASWIGAVLEVRSATSDARDADDVEFEIGAPNQEISVVGAGMSVAQ